MGNNTGVRFVGGAGGGRGEGSALASEYIRAGAARKSAGHKGRPGPNSERRSGVGGGRAAGAGTKSDEMQHPAEGKGKNTCSEAGDAFSTRGEVEPWGDAGRTWGVACLMRTRHGVAETAGQVAVAETKRKKKVRAAETCGSRGIGEC